MELISYHKIICQGNRSIVIPLPKSGTTWM